MKKIFKNNIFTNPEGWAGIVVGTNLRYRLVQIWTIFMGIVLFTLSCIVSNRRGLRIYLEVFVLIGVVAVEMPLLYLKALRHLYLKNKQSQDNQDK